jgi:V8-like Glu-specific endopeptidase
MFIKIISLFFFIIYICILNLSSSFSGTIDPNNPDSKYVEYAKEFDFVGKLCGQYEDNTNFCASAVLISESTIITAAHVVNNYKTCNFIINKKNYRLIKIIPHALYDYDTDDCSYDIAIGHLENKAIISKYPELYEKDDEVGKKIVMVGYGLTGNFMTGSKIYDSKKRAGTNTIDRIHRNTLVCSPSRKNDTDYTSLEFLISSGDSGGPLLIDNKVAGIASCIMSTGNKPNSSYENESFHTRISVFKDWIIKNKK